MTATYDKLGLKFLYPENWKLIDEADPDVPHVVSLEGPDGSSTWTVHLYPHETDGEALLKESLATLMETYEDCEISKIEGELAGFTANGVEAMFYCLDFLIQAQLRIVKTREHVLLVWVQAEDRDFDEKRIVFEAISTSLLQSLA